MKSSGANVAFPGARSISHGSDTAGIWEVVRLPQNALGTNQILSGTSHFAEGWNCLLLTAPLHGTIAQIAKRVFPCRPWSEITDAEGLPEDSGEGKKIKHVLSPKVFHLLTALAFLSFYQMKLLFLNSISASTFASFRDAPLNVSYCEKQTCMHRAGD